MAVLACEVAYIAIFRSIDTRIPTGRRIKDNGDVFRDQSCVTDCRGRQGHLAQRCHRYDRLEAAARSCRGFAKQRPRHQEAGSGCIQSGMIKLRRMTRRLRVDS